MADLIRQDDVSQRKTCSKCARSLPIADFHRYSRNLDGLQSYCRSCMRDYNRARRARGDHRDATLRYYFNIGQDDYDQLLAQQHGGCAVCGTTDPTNGRQGTAYFCVDHDHGCCPEDRSCGACVRGLLCTDCNKLLGCAHDAPEVLMSAVQYLSAKLATSR